MTLVRTHGRKKKINFKRVIKGENQKYIFIIPQISTPYILDTDQVVEIN